MRGESTTLSDVDEQFSRITTGFNLDGLIQYIETYFDSDLYCLYRFIPFIPFSQVYSASTGLSLKKYIWGRFLGYGGIL